MRLIVIQLALKKCLEVVLTNEIVYCPFHKLLSIPFYMWHLHVQRPGILNIYHAKTSGLIELQLQSQI